MTNSQKIRFAFIVVLWLLLCYLLLTRATHIGGYEIFTIVASAIIVFVPLYKKYRKQK